jgi:ion channel
MQLRSLEARIEDAFGLVLLLVLATYVMASLIPFKGWGAVPTIVVGSFAATVALASARARLRLVTWARRFAFATVLVAVAGALADSPKVIGVAAVMLSLLFTVGALAVLRAVLAEERVGFRTVLGAVSVYITLGLLFGFLYVFVDRMQGPFFGDSVSVKTGDFLFFSMTTLTTTGYGNLVPAAQPGKMFAVIEMLMGQIFLVTLIARLVSQWSPGEWLRGGAGIAEPERDSGPS